jgi:outer membrane immunogenic protein
MRTWLGSVVAVLAIGAGVPAFAADMPLKAPAPIAAPTWGGFYVGGNIGYGWGGDTNPLVSYSDTSTVAPFQLALQQIFSEGVTKFSSLNPSGVIGGVQVGYNFQSGPWVLGGVADFQFSGMRATLNSTPFLPVSGTPINQSLTADIHWLSTVRARFGYAAQNWLFYGTGGLAVGEVASAISQGIRIIGFDAMSGSLTETRTGYAAGAGVEYAISRQWSIGAEYLYFNLGRSTVTALPNAAMAVGAPLAVMTASQQFNGQIARATVNFHF